MALIALLRFKWTYLVAGVILLAIGAVLLLTAHPSHPVEVDGTEASYFEITKSGNYDHNELTLVGDSNTYKLDKTTFHPTLPDEVYKGGKINIWIDQGTTTIIAITLYDQNDENPTKYTTDVYDNPSTETSNSQGAGIVAAVIGVILLAIFGLMFVLGQRGGPMAMPAGGAVMMPPVSVPATSATPSMPATPPATPGSGVGLSADGMWYWDGAQWRNVSPDRRYRWDGAQWVELGAVGSAMESPPHG